MTAHGDFSNAPRAVSSVRPSCRFPRSPPSPLLSSPGERRGPGACLLRRWIKRIAVTGLLGLLAFVFGFLPWWLAGIFTSGRFQMKDAANGGLTPAAFSLPFEDVALASRDGVPLKGWWVPAEHARGTVVLVHGLNRSRIEMVKKTPFVNRQGWNSLLFDLRRHGESGGELRSLGYNERLDVLGALDFARKRSPGPVVLWGISFGGAASTLAAAEEPAVAGLVCDSSFRSLRDTARHHVAIARRWRWWMAFVPAGPVAAEAVFWMGRRAGFDPDALDIARAAAALRGRPALFVGATGDERMPPDIARDLRDAAGEKASVLVVTSEGHGHAYKDGPEAYEKAVAALLDAVAPPGGAPAVTSEGAKP